MTNIDLCLEEKHPEHFGIRYAITKTLFSQKSEFQQIDVVETRGHGKMLFNDGLAMVSERDEFVYHDMIAHVPLFVYPDPKQILVIGGGDGGTLREVLRHKSVERCVMVEIDKVVIDACRNFIPQTSFKLDSPRAELRIEDGVKYVADCKDKFDVVLIDSTDPIGPATPLFGEEFYQNVHALLNEDGIVVSQGESPFFDKKWQEKLLTIKGKFFTKTHIYNFSNLTYPGGLWSFTYASNKYSPTKDFDPSRVTDSGLRFEYYNEGIHLAAFALPQFQRDNLDALLGDQ